MSGLGRPRAEVRTCSMADCQDEFHARGLCKRHYLAWYQGRLDVETQALITPKRSRSRRVVRTPVPEMMAEDAAFSWAWESLSVEQQFTFRAHALGAERGQVAEERCVNPATIKGRLNTIFHRLGWRGSYGGGRRAAYFLGRYDGRRDT